MTDIQETTNIVTKSAVLGFPLTDSQLSRCLRKTPDLFYEGIAWEKWD